MMTVDTGTSPDGTGFSDGERPASDPFEQLYRRLDTQDQKLDDIIYAIQQVEEKLHDLAQNQGLGMDD